MNINEDKLLAAIGSALKALNIPASAITTAPEQFDGENWRGDVSIPYNDLAQLLRAIHQMQFELAHNMQYVENNERLERLFLEGWEIHADPRETDAKKRDKAIRINQYGGRPKKNYGLIEFQYRQLREQGFSAEEAYRTLDQRYHLDEGSTKRGLSRYRQNKKDK